MEQLIDEWLVNHPEHQPLPHADDDEQRSVVHTAGAESSAAVEVTDPGSLAESDAAEPSADGADESASDTAPEGAAAPSGRSA